MTKLEQTLKAIKEENLSKEKLDQLYSELSLLRADVRMELSGLLKKRAMFIIEQTGLSIAQREATWRATPDGQREIDLKSYVLALKDALESVKTRIYSML